MEVMTQLLHKFVMALFKFHGLRVSFPWLDLIIISPMDSLLLDLLQLSFN